MRNYDARLARIEKALLPKQPIEIRVVYCDMDLEGKPVKRSFNGFNSGIDYRRDLHRIAPIAVVAPGLIDSLMDDTPVPLPGADSHGAGADRQPALDPPAPPEQPKWNFEQARRQMLEDERARRPRTFVRVSGY